MWGPDSYCESAGVGLIAGLLFQLLDSLTPRDGMLDLTSYYDPGRRRWNANPHLTRFWHNLPDTQHDDLITVISDSSSSASAQTFSPGYHALRNIHGFLWGETDGVVPSYSAALNTDFTFNNKDSATVPGSGSLLNSLRGSLDRVVFVDRDHSQIVRGCTQCDPYWGEPSDPNKPATYDPYLDVIAALLVELFEYRK